MNAVDIVLIVAMSIALTALLSGIAYIIHDTVTHKSTVRVCMSCNAQVTGIHEHIN